jgi:hypothetical protein
MSKLRGTKITGSWSDKQPHGREGKRCEVTSTGGASMRDVKECAKVCSSHWFDRDTMRFFKSRVGDKAYADGRGGAFFVSSEQGPHMARAYSVRHYSADRCGIDTVGDFMGHKTSAQATAAAKKLAAKGGSELGRARRRRR